MSNFQGKKIHPSGCGVYPTSRKMEKKKKIPVDVPLLYKSSLKKVLQKHKLHFGDGGGSWLDVYSGQQGYLS